MGNDDAAAPRWSVGDLVVLPDGTSGRVVFVETDHDGVMSDDGTADLHVSTDERGVEIWSPDLVQRDGAHHAPTEE